MGRKSFCCTLMSLKTYKQIIKSEVIVILRRVSPRKWRTVQGPEGSLFKVSLTVSSFAPSFLVVLFSPCQASFISSGEQAGPGLARRAPAPCFPVKHVMNLCPSPLEQPGGCWGSVEWRSRCPGLCHRMEGRKCCRSPLLRCCPHLGGGTSVRCVQQRH